MRITLLLALAQLLVATAGASAQVRHVAATLEASRPSETAEPEAPAPPDRTVVLSVTLGAGLARWHDFVAYYNEEEGRYDAIEIEGSAFVVAEMTGFAGAVVATGASGHVEHALGYLLHASSDDTALVHRHQLAYRLDSRWFGLTVNLGLSAITPYGGGPTHTGVGFGIGTHAYVHGPLFVELRYQADMVGTGDPSMNTYGLALGLANL